MGRLKSLKSGTFSFVLVLFLISIVGTACASGPDNSKQGLPAKNQKTLKNMPTHKGKMNLNLTDKQQALFQKMRDSGAKFRTKMCPDKGADCTPDREQIRAMYLFKAELAAEKPDFQTVAKKIKGEYHGQFKTEFNLAIDAKAAFLESLTPEQRDTLLSRRPRAGGKSMYKGHPMGKKQYYRGSAGESSVPGRSVK